MKTSVSAETHAIDQIRAKGGTIHTKTAINSGIYSRTLAELVQKGKLKSSQEGSTD